MIEATRILSGLNNPTNGYKQNGLAKTELPPLAVDSTNGTSSGYDGINGAGRFSAKYLIENAANKSQATSEVPSLNHSRPVEFTPTGEGAIYIKTVIGPKGSTRYLITAVPDPKVQQPRTPTPVQIFFKSLERRHDNSIPQKQALATKPNSDSNHAEQSGNESGVRLLNIPTPQETPLPIKSPEEIATRIALHKNTRRLIDDMIHLIGPVETEQNPSIFRTELQPLDEENLIGFTHKSTGDEIKIVRKNSGITEYLRLPPIARPQDDSLYQLVKTVNEDGSVPSNGTGSYSPILDGLIKIEVGENGTRLTLDSIDQNVEASTDKLISLPLSDSQVERFIERISVMGGKTISDRRNGSHESTIPANDKPVETESDEEELDPLKDTRGLINNKVTKLGIDLYGPAPRETSDRVSLPQLFVDETGNTLKTTFVSNPLLKAFEVRVNHPNSLLYPGLKEEIRFSGEQGVYRFDKGTLTHHSAFFGKLDRSRGFVIKGKDYTNDLKNKGLIWELPLDESLSTQAMNAIERMALKNSGPQEIAGWKAKVKNLLRKVPFVTRLLT